MGGERSGKGRGKGQVTGASWTPPTATAPLTNPPHTAPPL